MLFSMSDFIKLHLLVGENMIFVIIIFKKKNYNRLCLPYNRPLRICMNCFGILLLKRLYLLLKRLIDYR